MSAQKFRYTRIKDIMYPGEIYFAWGGNGEDLEKFMDKKWSVIIDDDDKNGDGYCVAIEAKNGYRLFLCYCREMKLEPDELSRFNHEIFHLVSHVFEHVGIKHDPQNEEAWAYYISYLTRIILNRVFRKKRRLQ